MKKEKIEVFDYAETIAKAIPKGILLNTNGEKWNAMVIGWGHLGVIWGMKTFTVYVRESRYTKKQLDETGRFTLSIPLDGKVDPQIAKVCGSMSGRDVNKADHVTLVDAECNGVSGVKEYPLTIECEVQYQQAQEEEAMNSYVLGRYYSDEEDQHNDHTAYIGKIVDAYIIRD